MIGRTIAIGLLSASPVLAADNIIDVSRGPDSIVFGSCVPSLIAVNRSPDVVDYLQVEIDFGLRDGRTHRLAFKSGYRHGIARPIAPGAARPLVVHADESRPLAAACADIVSIRIVDADCEAASAPCRAPIAVKAER